jgi:GxxExxY protein
MDDAFQLHRDLTDRIIKVFWAVVNELGTGYLERIYFRAMVIALRQEGLDVDEKYTTVVFFRGQEVGRHSFDLVINGVILLELKASNAFERWHAAQTIGYLRSCEIEVGLILNFGPNPCVRRVSLSNDRKQIKQVRDEESSGEL